jgi:hypothetical protein
VDRRRHRPDSNLDRPFVFNAGMNGTTTRFLLAASAALAAVLVAPGAASARIIEVGQTTAAAAPSCPTSPCEVISRTTAFQTRVDGKRKLFVAPAEGRIVAWTIMGDRRYGRVTGESPVVNLTPYFGETVQFPLASSIPINKGDVVALTVPTWAPALGLGLARNSVWRASRDVDACDDTQTQSAQGAVQDLARYRCAYRTARVTYSATLITTPVPPKPEPTPRRRPSR